MAKKQKSETEEPADGSPGMRGPQVLVIPRYEGSPGMRGPHPRYKGTPGMRGPQV